MLIRCVAFRPQTNRTRKSDARARARVCGGRRVRDVLGDDNGTTYVVTATAVDRGGMAAQARVRFFRVEQNNTIVVKRRTGGGGKPSGNLHARSSLARGSVENVFINGHTE